MVDEQKEILTIGEVSELYGIAKGTIYNWVSGDTVKIPHYKPAKTILRFKRSELDKWFNDTRVAPDKEIASKATAA